MKLNISKDGKVADSIDDTPESERPLHSDFVHASDMNSPKREVAINVIESALIACAISLPRCGHPADLVTCMLNGLFAAANIAGIPLTRIAATVSAAADQQTSTEAEQKAAAKIALTRSIAIAEEIDAHALVNRVARMRRGAGEVQQITPDETPDG